MNKIRSARITQSVVIAAFCLITVLTSAAPAKAQKVPTARKTLSYQEAIKDAVDQRRENWKRLRDPLVVDKKAMLAQLTKTYEAKIDAASSVPEAKALRKELDTEGKKISAFIREEFDKALKSVNKVFVYNVEQICEQYSQPIPRWLGGYRER